MTVIEPSLRRVSVTSGGRQLDVALPAYTSIAELTGQLMQALWPAASGPPPQGAAWALARLAGPLLPMESCLAVEGVVDGDVLELTHRVDLRPALVDDTVSNVAEYGNARRRIVDSIAESAAAVALATTLTAATAVCTAVAVGRPAVHTGDRVLLAVAAAMIVLANVVVCILAARRDREWVSLLAAAAGPPAAAAAVWCGVSGRSEYLAAGLAAGSAVSLAVLQQVVARVTRPVAVAAALAAAAVWIAEPMVAFEGTRRAAVVLLLLAVLAVGAMPRLSFGGVGLAMLDARVRSGDQVPVQTLRARVRAGSGTLQLVLWLCAVVGAAAGAVLVPVGGWAFGLLAVLSVACWLRVFGLFTAVVHAAPLIACAVALTVETALSAGRWLSSDWARVVVAAVVVAPALMAAGALTLAAPPSWARAQASLIVRWVEVAVLAAAVVCAAGALGVFTAVHGLGG